MILDSISFLLGSLGFISSVGIISFL